MKTETLDGILGMIFGIVCLLIGLWVGASWQGNKVDADIQPGLRDCDSTHANYIIREVLVVDTTEIAALRDTNVILRQEQEKPKPIFKKAGGYYRQKLYPPYPDADTAWGNANEIVYVSPENLDWLYQFSRWGIANGITSKADTMIVAKGIVIRRECDDGEDHATITVLGCLDSASHSRLQEQEKPNGR